MTHPSRDSNDADVTALERELSSLTGGAAGTDLASRAWDSAKTRGSAALPGRSVAYGVLALFLCLGAGLILVNGSMGRARMNPPTASMALRPEAAVMSDPGMVYGRGEMEQNALSAEGSVFADAAVSEKSLAAEAPPVANAAPAVTALMELPAVASAPASRVDAAREARAPMAKTRAAAAPATEAASAARAALPDPSLRFVARKASMELSSTDVRAGFLKAQMIIDETRGEFIEQSTLTGEGPGLYASLTLRVASERLSEVLGQLRGLGKVTSEQASGEDITDRVVDLEARLRNEQRVERELQELMEKRQGASLKDVLDLREQIDRSRGRIEQMQGQREKFGRLASLATVLVTIRAENSAVVQQTSSWGEARGKFARAWSRGVDDLVSSTAGLVEFVIGGVWVWVGLAAVAIGLRAMWHRAGVMRASEPPPRE
jgi:polyhydroxyalkanoate synthesis regulator phasin